MLLLLSALFLITMAAVTIVMFAFPPSNDYLDINYDVTARNASLVYFCTGLMLAGLSLLVMLVVMVLHCHDNNNLRNIAIVSCLATALLTLATLLLFAIQPESLMTKLFPGEDPIFEPIRDAYFPAVQRLGSPGNEQLTRTLKTLQADQSCCLYYGPEGTDSTSCLVLDSGGQVSKNAYHCTEYFYVYYASWLENAAFVVRIAAVLLSVQLALAICLQVTVLAREASRRASAHRPGGRLQLNLGHAQPVPYVYFTSDELFQGKGLKNEGFQGFGRLDGVGEGQGQGEVKSQGQGGSPLCVMTEY